MTWQVIALVDEGKPEWTPVVLDQKQTERMAKREYRMWRRIMQDGGFDTSVKGITLEQSERPGAATPDETDQSRRTRKDKT